MQKKIEIIYEDQYLVVCRKMPGIPVQTAKMGQQDMVSLLRSYYAAKGKDTQIFVVHRLDQPVEGIMVLYKSFACFAFGVPLGTTLEVFDFPSRKRSSSKTPEDGFNLPSTRAK